LGFLDIAEHDQEKRLTYY